MSTCSSLTRQKFLATAAASAAGSVLLNFFIWDAYQNNSVSAVILAVFYRGAVRLLLDR